MEGGVYSSDDKTGAYSNQLTVKDNTIIQNCHSKAGGGIYIAPYLGGIGPHVTIDGNVCIE